MKLHPNTVLILGPPGTGKTTTLLNHLEKLLDKGVSPEAIAYVSFTKKAANEARERAMKKFNLPEESFRWFRTLHSMAYRFLSLRRDDVVSPGDLIEFAKEVGVYIDLSSYKFDDGTITDSSSPGTEMLFLDNLSRMRCEDLRVTWSKFGNDKVTQTKLEHFADAYKKFKLERGILDFTDMIQRCVEEGCCTGYGLRFVFIDEAQDLTQLQWRMCQQVVYGATQVLVAGDDDQSIYAWSGADVETFLNMEVKKKHVLKKSFRLPREVFDAAETIAQRITSRYAKAWSPREGDPGVVHPVWQIEQVPLEEGEWLILARNKCFLPDLVDYCRTLGYPYTSPISKPLESGALEAIRTWERLRKGFAVPAIHARKAYEFLKLGVGVRRGCKALPGVTDAEMLDISVLQREHGLLTTAIWHEALDRIPVEDREYFISILRKGEKLTPRIHIGTIHGSKGGEADNVLLLQDMTNRSMRGYEKDPDSEHRVFYVGVTRAKKRLYLLEPTGRNCYSVLS